MVANLHPLQVKNSGVKNTSQTNVAVNHLLQANGFVRNANQINVNAKLSVVLLHLLLHLHVKRSGSARSVQVHRLVQVLHVLHLLVAFVLMDTNINVSVLTRI